MQKNLHIAIIGFGNIGEWILEKLIQRAIFDKYFIIEKITCIAIDQKKSNSKISDQKQSLLNLSIFSPEFCGIHYIDKINFSTNYETLRDADYIITSFSIQMNEKIKDRSDLLLANDKISSEICQKLKAVISKNAFIINIANPLDVMTWRIMEKLCFPKDQILGIAGMIDATRLAEAIHHVLNIPFSNIDLNSLSVIGEHGDSMVPLLSNVTVSGKKLETFVAIDKLEQIKKYTQARGTEMLMQNSFIPPHIIVAQAVVTTIYSLELQNQTKHVASVWNEEEHCFLGTPVLLGGKKMNNINKNLINMSKDEQASLVASGNKIKKDYQYIIENQVSL